MIINSTITIGAGRVYFVETRNAKVKASSSRRVSMPEMWLDQFLVALDVDSENPTGALGLYTGMGFVATSRSVAHVEEL